MTNVDITQNTQSVLSLCPGILGLEKGIERAFRSLNNSTIRVIAYVEIEAFIIANLVGQMESGLLAPAPIWTDVKTFDARPFRNKIHGIIGGYPCQPFSHAGERKGTDDPRHLWPHILEQIKIIGPEWVYFENVAGHLSLGYEEVRRSLSDIGYRVEEGIFTAEEVGAPHRRERLFILGILDNAINPGLQGHPGDDSGAEGRTKQKRSVTASGLFPAGQGNYQHEWEEPRTIESSLVYTIDGYNFTEDLHRAIGNSVVEQTAELAFITLLQKHIKNQSV